MGVGLLTSQYLFDMTQESIVLRITFDNLVFHG